MWVGSKGVHPKPLDHGVGVWDHGRCHRSDVRHERWRVPVFARKSNPRLNQILKRPQEVVFECPQPPAPFPPSQRSGAFIGPSGGGKTTTAIPMLMGAYKHCYSRVYIFSPSCAPGVGPAWNAWRKHVKVHMRVPNDEQTMWGSWAPETFKQLNGATCHSTFKAHEAPQQDVILALADDFWRRWREGHAFINKHTD